MLELLEVVQRLESFVTSLEQRASRQTWTPPIVHLCDSTAPSPPVSTLPAWSPCAAAWTCLPPWNSGIPAANSVASSFTSGSLPGFPSAAWDSHAWPYCAGSAPPQSRGFNDYDSSAAFTSPLGERSMSSRNARRAYARRARNRRTQRSATTESTATDVASDATVAGANEAPCGSATAKSQAGEPRCASRDWRARRARNRRTQHTADATGPNAPKFGHGDPPGRKVRAESVVGEPPPDLEASPLVSRYTLPQLPYGDGANAGGLFDGFARVFRASRTLAQRPRCSLPLKPLVTGTIDLQAVLAMASPVHRESVQEVAAILDGTHRAWRHLWGKRLKRAIPSRLTAEQLEAALQMRLLREVAVRPTLTARMYCVPKSDGVTSRPIFDARLQNSYIDWSCVSTRLRLLRPLSHVRVGLVVGESDPLIAEVDATSYFPAFRWCDRLARHHGVYADGRYFVHRVPAQGSALMPLVAQTVSASLADAPSVGAPDVAWVRSRVSIIYDNWLVSGSAATLPARVKRLCARLQEAGVVVGEVKGPSTSLESCGFRFDVGGGRRRWSLKPSWCEKAQACLAELATTLHGRQVQAGIALWATRALLLPTGLLHHLIRPLLECNTTAMDASSRDMHVPPSVAARDDLSYVSALIATNPWRVLITDGYGARSELRDATVVYSDASIYGAGAVEVGRGSTSWPWPQTRAAADQQLLEAEAALLALRWASRSRTVLLVVDNEGVAGWLLSGNPQSSRALPVLLDIWRLLRARRTSLWVAVVPSGEMLADGPSRLAAEPVFIDTPPASIYDLALEVEWSAAADYD